MKYLGLHKLLWFLIVLFWIIIELISVFISYVAYFIWNLKLKKGNLWYDFHSGESDLDGTPFKDYNPWQTLIRRYSMLFDLT